MDRYPEEIIEEEEVLLSRVDMLGELATLFKGRGCKGDCGKEFDRRSAFLADALTKSFEDAWRRTVPETGALIASLRVLRAVLITSVAKIDLSLGDS